MSESAANEVTIRRERQEENDKKRVKSDKVRQYEKQQYETKCKYFEAKHANHLISKHSRLTKLEAQHSHLLTEIQHLEEEEEKAMMKRSLIISNRSQSESQLV